jgi:hypothetical protein
MLVGHRLTNSLTVSLESIRSDFNLTSSDVEEMAFSLSSST